MNAKAAAEILNVSLTTISTYIKEGLLIPDNMNSWHIEGEYIIPDDQVNELKEKLYPGGLTTKQTSEYVGNGCKPYQVLNAINKGLLTVKVSDVLSKPVYYVQEDDKLEQFKHTFHIKKDKNQKHFDSQQRIFLYQSYRDKESGEVVRVMSIDKEEGYALNAMGERISLTHLSLHYEPLTDYHIGKLNNRIGDVTFSFIMPSHIRALTYKFIEKIAEESGVRNYSIEETDQKLIVKCKPFLIRFDESSVDHELLDHAKRSLIKGKVQERKEDFFFASTDRKVSLVLEDEMFSEIEKRAKNEGLDVDTFISKTLRTTLTINNTDSGCINV
ncbi:DNA-binding protein (plasmid) [Alkalihalophilus pseudofirmus]|uniref:DNA-binding protein n=1 Tax=Alkalihalophilus pseudofirmus TaxID=79885 RepID=UPI00259B6595|nr:DNA-binding protein [Alkalihalophilus pseudofirmus]WEG19185.1 DNA-binding protein [Alkalihalophilus pseudofirmus]